MRIIIGGLPESSARACRARLQKCFLTPALATCCDRCRGKQDRRAAVAIPCQYILEQSELGMPIKLPCLHVSPVSGSTHVGSLTVWVSRQPGPQMRPLDWA